jgi:hypothetical protein
MRRTQHVASWSKREIRAGETRRFLAKRMISPEGSALLGRGNVGRCRLSQCVLKQEGRAGIAVAAREISSPQDSFSHAEAGAHVPDGLLLTGTRLSFTAHRFHADAVTASTPQRSAF